MQKLLNLINLKRQPKIKEDPPPSQNQSPNLLNYKIAKRNIIEVYSKAINSVALYPAALLQSLFIVLIILHLLLNAKLDRTVDEITVLEDTLLSQSNIYENTKLLDRRIRIYKQVENSRVLINQDIQNVISTIPSDVIVNEMHFDTKNALYKNKVSLKLTAPSALRVAFLIARFLESASVDQVVLNSATLRTSSEEFVVQLDIETK